MPKIKFSMNTNKVGSESTTTVDVDDFDWSEWDENDREDAMKEMFWDNVMSQLGGWDWEVI